VQALELLFFPLRLEIGLGVTSGITISPSSESIGNGEFAPRERRGERSNSSSSAILAFVARNSTTPEAERRWEGSENSLLGSKTMEFHENEKDRTLEQKSDRKPHNKLPH